MWHFCDDKDKEEEEEERGILFEYEEGDAVVQERWNENHAKLVYLISRFGRSAMTANEKETWLRQVGR